MKPTRRISGLWALLILFAITSSAVAASTPSAETLFQQGNDLYGQGRYQEALQIYVRIADREGVSAALFYNLANCCAQTGQTGQAVLNYKRALRLSPADSDIKGNLDLLERNAGLFRQEVSWPNRMAALLDLDQWCLLAGFALMILTLISLAGLRLHNGRQLGRWISAACLLIILLSSAGIAARYRQLDEAVVVGSDARLLLSPFPAASPIGAIREGQTMYYRSQHGAYALVEDETGRSGWIAVKDIGLVRGTASGSTPPFKQAE
ncbi:MAG: tetratricopeptide repeat protein [Desulfocapsaceae bacterium]|nr:tetratricopeptide repeat protein [Desulfocapsaceae bacterium]